MTTKRTAPLDDQEQAALVQHRTEWLAHGLSCEPADRARAEASIVEMYRLIGEDPPRFLWCESPATGIVGVTALRGDRASLRNSLWTSLGDSLRDSLWASLRDSLGDSLRDSLRDSLGASLGDSLGASLGASLWDSLGDSLGDSLRASLWDSLGDSLRDSLGDSLRDSLGDSLRDSLGASLGDSLGASLGASLWDSRVFGQHESYWIAYYLFGAEHLGVRYDPARAAQLGLWADLARSTGWWWPYRGLVVCSERPAEVHTEPAGVDDRRQLHHETGPALRYRDGWAVHAWHGTRVPADLIETDWTVEQILAESNTEIRRCAIEKHGWPEFLSALGAAPIDDCDDPGNPGHRLRLYDLPDQAQVYAERVRLVVMENASRDRDGSRRTFAETVPAKIDSALGAQAWAFGVEPDTYAQVARAT